MAKLVWRVVCSALLPVTLRDLQDVLAPFVAHIGQANERGTRHRQRDSTQAMLG